MDGLHDRIPRQFRRTKIRRLRVAATPRLGTDILRRLTADAAAPETIKKVLLFNLISMGCAQ